MPTYLGAVERMNPCRTEWIRRRIKRRQPWSSALALTASRHVDPDPEQDHLRGLHGKDQKRGKKRIFSCANIIADPVVTGLHKFAASNVAGQKATGGTARCISVQRNSFLPARHASHYVLPSFRKACKT